MRYWERDAAIPYNSDKKVVRGLKGKILEFSSIVRKQNGRQASSQSPHLEAEYEQNAIASGNLPAQAKQCTHTGTPDSNEQGL